MYVGDAYLAVCVVLPCIFAGAIVLPAATAGASEPYSMSAAKSPASDGRKRTAMKDKKAAGNIGVADSSSDKRCGRTSGT
jgi:hypothetical protein